MAYTYLSFEERDGLAFITVNRPDKLNALNVDVIADLEAAVARVKSTPAIRAAIVTGAGPKAFVAGADIGHLATLDARAGREDSRRGQRLLDEIERMGKPFIAAINGFALGGGMELALACHIRIAATGARMGLPEVKLGIIPGYGGTQRLPLIVGKGRALEMILSGEMIDADEAYRIGLVNKVVPAGELLGAAEALARAIMARGPIAVRYAIEAVHRGLAAGHEEGQRVESDLFGLLASTADMREGMAAFIEKRPARFQDR